MSEPVSNCSQHSNEIRNKPFLRRGPEEERKRGRGSSKGPGTVAGIGVMDEKGNQSHLSAACQ